jgi:hypothetical protein
MLWRQGSFALGAGIEMVQNANRKPFVAVCVDHADGQVKQPWRVLVLERSRVKFFWSRRT